MDHLSFRDIAQRFFHRRAQVCADLAVFHDFAPPPSGGGHQFMRALMREMTEQGWRVEHNQIPRATHACLFNSFNFDFKRLKRQLKKHGCFCVHRVDGPIAVYRGFDDGTDLRIAEINEELADATVFQSQYSLDKHRELGFELAEPVIIPNAADPAIFNANERTHWDGRRPLRIISASWSDNPNKGAATYKWLDEHLDFKQYEYTFVGRIQESFKNIRHIQPVDSETLAVELRRHDVFITASRNDPCSNSVIEALSCGLPVIYLNSGGHPELVQEAGLAFHESDEIPGCLESIGRDYDRYQSMISLPSIEDIARQYLHALKLS
jgi:glycosyltransferase involved in cell wall biosynthesis